MVGEHHQKYTQGDAQGAELPYYFGGLGSMKI